MSTTTSVYDRTRPGDNYERHLFRADRVLQSAELNEVQTTINARMRGIADAIYKDGDVTRDARITVNPDTGVTACGNGAVYVAGAVRGVAPATLTIAVVGIVNVGLYLRKTIVSELDDPVLLNPAAGTRGYQAPGALREQVNLHWGFSGDGQVGDFFPVYVVEDGYVRSKEPPPNLDATTQAIARYDRDSAGGAYIISGLGLSIMADDGGGQVYSLAAGRARVYGYAVDLQTSRRLRYNALADLRRIDNEPHLSTTAGAQRILFDRPAATNVFRVSIIAERTVDIVHSVVTNSQDVLPDTSVLSISSIRQGATTYAPGPDYRLTAGKADWSPAGAEPAGGSTYQITYRHIKLVQPTAVDGLGLTVVGAVPDTIVEISYDQMLPRLDRLCLTSEGAFVWLQGVASDVNPQLPNVPGDMLAIATVVQTWGAGRYVIDNAVHVVPMPQIASLFAKFDLLAALAAQQRLNSDIHTREAGVKKGLFTDPFTDDSLRDAGVPQTAAIVRGELVLPIACTVKQMGADIVQPASLAYTHGVALEQLLRTGSMKINPYQSFAILPAEVKLVPDVDRWTEVDTAWASPLTERFVNGTPTAVIGGTAPSNTSTSTSVRSALLSSTTGAAEKLRRIPLTFTLGGIAPGDTLVEAIFDGVGVLPGGPALVANAQGQITGTFMIPAGLPAGTKRFTIATAGGKTGSATFTGQGTIERQTWQQQTSVTTTYQSAPAATHIGGSGVAVVGPSSGSQGAPSGATSWDRFWNGITGAGKNQYFNGVIWIDPLAQTFTLPLSTQVTGVDLPFIVRPTSPVRVQLRETTAGVPNQSVLAEAVMEPAALQLGGAMTRVVFPAPQMLVSNTEYALVVLCNDPAGALGIAEIGQYDESAKTYIGSQPYTIGVLLSSSNARTWTAHQDRDMTFRLLRADYTQTSRTVELGSVAVADCTDLLLMAYADRPSSATYVDYVLTLPDGKAYTVSDGQAVQLPAAITGNVAVAARMAGSVDYSPLLFPGTQLVAGKVAATGEYVSRAIPCGPNATVKVIVEAFVPSGASFEVHYSGTDAGNTWQPMTAPTQAAADDGFTEFTFARGNVSTTAVRIRLVLRGTSSARPRLRDLRALVL